MTDEDPSPFDMRSRITAEEAEIARQRQARRRTRPAWPWRIAEGAAFVFGALIALLILALFLFSAWAPPID